MRTFKLLLFDSNILWLLLLALAISWVAIKLSEFDFAVLFLLSAITMVVSYLLMNRINPVFDFTRLTVPGFFLYTYIIMIYIPGFFVFFYNPGLYRTPFLVAVHSVLLTIPVGALLANNLFAVQQGELSQFCESNTEALFLQQSKFFLVSVLMVSILFVVIFLFETKQIPLFFILKNPHIYVLSRILRLETHHLSESSFRYIYWWLKTVIFPLIVVYSFGNYLVSEDKFWLRFFIGSFLIGIFYNSLALEKLPAASIFFVLILFYLIYRKWRVSPLLFAGAPVVLLAVPYFVYWLVRQKGELTLFTSIMEEIFRRLFYVPAEVLYNYFEVFPSKLDFLYGASSRSIAFVLGKEFFDVPKFVFKYWFGSPLLGHANACFIGNLHADWGLAGVVIGGIFAGFLMQAGQILIIRHSRSVLSLTVLTFFMYAAWILNSGELLATINSQGVLITLGFFLFLRRYERK